MVLTLTTGGSMSGYSRTAMLRSANRPKMISTSEMTVAKTGRLIETSDSIMAAPSRQLSLRSEEHTSELQSLMRISYAVFCLKKKHNTKYHHASNHNCRAKQNS